MSNKPLNPLNYSSGSAVSLEFQAMLSTNIKKYRCKGKMKNKDKYKTKNLKTNNFFLVSFLSASSLITNMHMDTITLSILKSHF